MKLMTMTLLSHAPDAVTGSHERLGHTILHLQADLVGFTAERRRRALERFQSEMAPTLCRDIPDPRWPSPVGSPEALASLLPAGKDSP